jgi:hypothetical protein
MLTGERPVDSLRTPPAPGWQLRVTGPMITFGNRQYPCNSILPNEILNSLNSAALLRSLRIGWCPPSDDPGPAPRELPKPVAAKPNPAVVIIDGNIIDVINWKQTEAKMIELCDGNAALARDLLLGDKRGQELWMKATQQYQRQQHKAGVPHGSIRQL